MANLKQTAAKIEQQTKQKLARGIVTLPLPIYDGLYAVRFGVLDEDAIEAFEQTTEDLTADQHREAEGAAGQLIADACRVILGRADVKADWESLEHDDSRPVRFDAAFAEALGLTAAPGHGMESGADVVLACWVTSEGDLASQALISYVERLLGFMRDTRAPVEGEIVEGPHGGLKSSG